MIDDSELIAAATFFRFWRRHHTEQVYLGHLYIISFGILEDIQIGNKKDELGNNYSFAVKGVHIA